jgi:hypothetical protein
MGQVEEKIDGLERTLTDMVKVVESEMIECDAKLAIVGSAARDALGGKFPPKQGAERDPDPDGTCSRCQAPIIWIKTMGGRNMPCDPKRQVITTSDGKSVSGFTSHFATCRKKG